MLQLSSHLLINGLGPQEAIDAPRWTVIPAEPGPPGALGLEGRFDTSVYRDLEAMGYAVEILPGFEDRGNLGSVASAIEVDLRRGIFRGGADPRADGVALAW
jgi:gamma-glutamyltranspeptidase/glutathione hydrolase